MIRIEASLLAADFLRLGEEIHKIEAAGADGLHIDVMDGHLVSDIAFGIENVKAIRAATALPLNAHLMVTNPEKYSLAMACTGIDTITIQLEPCRELYRTITEVKSTSARACVSIAPETSPVMLEPVLDWVDEVLLVSVPLGLGGQKFISSIRHKIQYLNDLRKSRKLDFTIGIDGGVTLENYGEITAYGVDCLIAGSCIFKSSDPASAVRLLQQR